MLMSMTGFGRESRDLPLGRFVVEIQSLNRKYFELQVYLPKEFSRFEYEMRKWVAEKVIRGFVTVRIQWIPSKDMLSHFLPDPQLIQNFKQEWERVASAAGFQKGAVDLAFLMQHIPSMPSTDIVREQDLLDLQTCVEAAIDRLVEMRQKEGASLSIDLHERLKNMKKMVKSIETLSKSSMERTRQKLQDKIKELTPETDERFIREIVLFVEKMDISEEVTRLNSHFSQFGECISSPQKAVGRKMDFLVQEMGREINTVGSKSMDVEISRLVVEMKSELERIREQIQNIE